MMMVMVMGRGRGDGNSAVADAYSAPSNLLMLRSADLLL